MVVGLLGRVDTGDTDARCGVTGAINDKDGRAAWKLAPAMLRLSLGLVLGA